MPAFNQLLVVVPQLLNATQYTIYLSLIAFAGGGVFAAVMTFALTYGARFSFAVHGDSVESSTSAWWRAFFKKVFQTKFFSLLWRAWSKLFSLFVSMYSWLFQATPLLMLLFICFFMPPAVLGVRVSSWTAAATALTLYASAYLAETWRGGVRAVPKTQWEGAMALGMPFLPTLRHIVLPQAIRFAAAPTINLLVQIIKATSLAYLIDFHDLMTVGKRWANSPVPHTSPEIIYPIMALIYFCLCFPLSVWARRLERRFNAERDRPHQSLAAEAPAIAHPPKP